jgi:hypothetical protein
MNEYKYIAELMETDRGKAAELATALLDKDPDDHQALFMVATGAVRSEAYGVSVTLLKRVCELVPKRSEPWNNLGMCYSGMCQHLKARQAYMKAWEREKKALYAANIAITYMEMREHKKSQEWCETALRLEADCKTALTTRALSRLATGQWEGGWKDHRHSLGNKFRKIIQYKDEPLWDGTPGKHLVIHGEQGIGDEIMYASCINDAMRDNSVIVECDPRLAGLFKRSFTCPVYGTRRVNEIEWPNDHEIDATIPCGQLPEFYRKKPEDCPGTPYLVADPERRIQWRALFDSWGTKPKIGIAWSGGSKHNNPSARAIGLEAFRILMLAIDADWVSLQYKDPSAEIEESMLPVRHFKRACETDDYDDTAALVAELDFVVSVPTSVVHLAGGLGVPTFALVHPEADWCWQVGCPWYDSVELFKKLDGEQWSKCLERFAAHLHRVRAETAAGLQRAPALDPAALVEADQYHPASALAAPH